jgi:uncharacterized Zn-finger protein
MTTYAKERRERLHWHEPTRDEKLIVHLFDERFPAWSICHRAQHSRGYAKVPNRPAVVCAYCSRQYESLLRWISQAERR